MNLSILSPILYQPESGDTMRNKKVLIIDDQKDFGFLIEAFFFEEG
jgi:hypothetical protein